MKQVTEETEEMKDQTGEMTEEVAAVETEEAAVARVVEDPADQVVVVEEEINLSNKTKDTSNKKLK